MQISVSGIRMESGIQLMIMGLKDYNSGNIGENSKLITFHMNTSYKVDKRYSVWDAIQK